MFAANNETASERRPVQDYEILATLNLSPDGIPSGAKNALRRCVIYFRPLKEL